MMTLKKNEKNYVFRECLMCTKIKEINQTFNQFVQLEITIQRIDLLDSVIDYVIDFIKVFFIYIKIKTKKM